MVLFLHACLLWLCEGWCLQCSRQLSLSDRGISSCWHNWHFQHLFNVRVRAPQAAQVSHLGACGPTKLWPGALHVLLSPGT